METALKSNNDYKHIDIILNDSGRQQRIAKIFLKDKKLKVRTILSYKNIDFSRYFDILDIDPENAMENDLFLLYDGMMKGEYIFATDVHSDKKCLFQYDRHDTENENNDEKKLVRARLQILFKKMEEATDLSEKEHYLNLIDEELNGNAASRM